MVEQLLDLSADRNTESGAIVRELERERARMGRELHAGVGQPLSGIKMNLAILESLTDGLPMPAKEALGRMQKLVDEALSQTRALAHDLCPPAWQMLPIATALGQLLDSSGIRTALEIDPALSEPSHAAKVALYRCAQECLSNTTRHSGATRFELSLKMKYLPGDDNHLLELAVRDNGRGIGSRGNGIGLESIHEHAGSLGGTATVTSNPQGTTIVISLPANVI